jgi:hypothetical protein
MRGNPPAFRLDFAAAARVLEDDPATWIDGRFDFCAARELVLAWGGVGM